jgi:hypothetical protein
MDDNILNPLDVKHLLRQAEHRHEAFEDLRLLVDLASPTYVLDQEGRERLHMMLVRLFERLERPGELET